MVIGVKRDGTLRTGATTRINEEDDALVAGTDVMIQEFKEATIRAPIL